MIIGYHILTSHGRHPSREQFATGDVRANAEELARRISLVFGAYGPDLDVTSGFRPQHVNDRLRENGKKAAKNSHHIFGAAADLGDNDRKFAMWCIHSVDILAHVKLWMEHPDYSRERNDAGEWVSWVHLQMIPPPSGKRIFIPYLGGPPK